MQLLLLFPARAIGRILLDLLSFLKLSLLLLVSLLLLLLLSISFYLNVHCIHFFVKLFSNISMDLSVSRIVGVQICHLHLHAANTWQHSLMCTFYLLCAGYTLFAYTIHDIRYTTLIFPVIACFNVQWKTFPKRVVSGGSDSRRRSDGKCKSLLENTR